VTFLFVVALGLVRWPLLLVCAVVGRGRLRADGEEPTKRKRWRIAAALVAMVLLGDLILDESGRIAPLPEAGGGERLTVLTYNVLFEGGDTDATVRTILEQDADLVFLQEVSARRADELHRGLRDRYPHRRTALPKQRGHGLVTYSTRPLTEIDSWASGRGNVVGHCLRMEPLVVCNVHLTSPSVAFDQPRRFLPILLDNERYRRGQIALIEEAASDHDGPVLLAGDINTMVVEPLFRDLRTRWVDAYRAVHPLHPGATYPHGSDGPPNRFMRPGVPLVRPDYVLISPDIRPVGAHTVDDGGSDHRPVVVTLELPG
jgi:endonuclease/exonuclease/phosphatase (EEP) superfamily protein YafD